MAIRLPASVRADMLRHARDQAPNECCGLLIGRGRLIEESIRVRNVADSPATRYLVDPAEHIAVARRLRGSSRSIVGAYHSHPASPPVPSERDRAEALYPEFVWMIVSLAESADPIAAFTMSGGSFTSVPIVVEAREMSAIIASVRSEFLRYKDLAESAIRQVSDAELSAPDSGGGNSIAVICWHVAGNLRSRFTDFLTSDGEKPWRRRDEEFEPRLVTREELLARWESGWHVLLDSLSALDDSQLHETVMIRGQSMHVHDALHRALAHVAYHAGQIVYVAKHLRGSEWNYLSIPPGQSDAVNAKMGMKP